MPTRALAVAAGTSKLIHDIASYILAQRLRHTLELGGYQLIYECYAAEDKYNHPYNHCEYNGAHAGTQAQKLKPSEFNSLSTLYTHFTPTPYDASHRFQQQCQISSVMPSQQLQPAWTSVTIDTGDLFTQVCAIAKLVRIGARGERSVIPVFESFFRVRRDWLDDACEEGNSVDGDSGVVWVGMGENVGLKLRVGERRITGACREDEPAVQYRVEYQSLVIRATYLLEAIEKRKHSSYIHAVSFMPQPAAIPALEPAVMAY
ncbi:hypothetical protein TWF696_005741 [Orbilia brochopaga]|uniref:Uncharacterized protein n=1 Tax=Orbilia brochopaga TaxID=3140254 RepID=A0AAV9UVF5_9PEZI